MLELPEAMTIANQIDMAMSGKRIVNVIAAQKPHKFAWYYGDPQKYYELLISKTIDEAKGYGGLVEIKAENTVILFSDGVGLKFHENNKQPRKHQLLIEFEDGSSLSASVQMYGGLRCFKAGEFENLYYKVARERPSPLTEEFDETYFKRMVSSSPVQKLSAKALLATEQRIPGVGNGVLQDILFNARIHPKQKISLLSDLECEALFSSIKTTLGEMTNLGGRDTEKDLYGRSGGYKTKLSKNTAGKPCPTCKGIVRRESFLGGSIYFCERCQPLL